MHIKSASECDGTAVAETAGSVETGEKISQLNEKSEAKMRQVGRCAERGRRYENQISKLRQRCAVILNLWNQLNQAYTYVQVPLKMSCQNANGELYVYTNKKNLRDPDAELSAYIWIWNTLALPMSQ